MDKTQPYDEPLDPHWEIIGAFGPTLEQMLEPGTPKRLEVIAENVVPFLVRKDRALEMVANLDRAIVDGHAATFVELGAIVATFRAFAEKADEFGFKVEGTVRRQHGGVPKDRDGWLVWYHEAWARLREFESDGFPLMDYVHTRHLDPPPLREDSRT